MKITNADITRLTDARRAAFSANALHPTPESAAHLAAVEAAIRDAMHAMRQQRDLAIPIRAAGYAVFDYGPESQDLSDYYGPVAVGLTPDAALRAYRESPGAGEVDTSPLLAWDGEPADGPMLVPVTEELLEWQFADGIEFAWAAIDGIACTSREYAVALGLTEDGMFYGPGTVGPDGGPGDAGRGGEGNRPDPNYRADAPADFDPEDCGMISVPPGELARLASIAGVDPSDRSPSEVLREVIAWACSRTQTEELYERYRRLSCVAEILGQHVMLD